jgi:diguanylate cyclase (GGDEF)-like protein
MQAAIPKDEPLRQAALDSHLITDTPEDDNFNRILRLACAAMAMPVGLISLVDRDRQWFKARIGMETCETPREHSFCAHAILEDDVLVVEDATLDARFADNPLVDCDGGIRFYAGAPLREAGGQPLGTLCVIDHIPRRLDGRERALLRDMAALVVNQLELRKMAGTDGLTGLFTRRLIDELGQRETARARRTHQPLSLALIDIDRFKAINDTFGHAAGDAVLRRLGPLCRDVLRPQDHLGRYGGEELVVVMPNTELSDAKHVLERLRDTVSRLRVGEIPDGRPVTVSIGAARLEERDANVGGILQRADAALYRAKEMGRNRVELERVS